MIEKTRGIILHQIKYTDSGIVTLIYTKDFGTMSFMIKGMRNRKAGKHNILFQPMFILDLVLYYKSNRNIQNMKEFSVSYTPYDIHTNIKKSSVAIFLGEVLTSVLREDSPNEDLFNYIEDAIIYFDSCADDYANFHIAFLAGLTGFLGIEPGQRASEDDQFFDLTNGTFVPVPPLNGNYANAEISHLLAGFFAASYDTIKTIPLSGIQRNEILETLIKYYSIHIPSIKKINSLEVLKEVFS